MSESKSQAIRDATYLFKYYERTVEKEKRKISYLRLIASEIKDVYNKANISMDRLVNNQGIYAGYPWFFQHWARDELICLKYLIDKGDLKKSEKILSKYFNQQIYDGRLPAIYPNIGNMSADAAGWLFLRYYEFHSALKSRHLLRRFRRISRDIEHLDKILYALRKYHMNDLLISSGKDETWMDTSAGDKERIGYCIEIQALCLRMHRVMYKLTKDEKYKSQEEEMKWQVVNKFFKNNMLIDCISPEGEEQSTTRPNIFIAYYVYPWLLSNEDWEKVFDKAIEDLWLEWGGFATIDKKSELFIDTYSGEDNTSYHRGDSWFYLNCMAAICMFKVNPCKYQEKIQKIINACCTEFNSGVIGSLAEVSSAKELIGYGCLSQAWSLAMFIELVNITQG